MRAFRQLLAILIVVFTAASVRAQDIAVDFRNKKVDEAALKEDGTNVPDYIKLEDEGAHLRFADGKAPKLPVGYRWNTRIVGDFTATVRYEILHEDRPDRGTGVGIELYMVPDLGQPRDGIAYARIMAPAAGPVYAFNYRTTTPTKNRISKDPVAPVPTSTKSKKGSLRLARAGTTLIISAADESGEFVEVFPRREVGDAPILMVRIAGLPGGIPNPELDLRFLEFTLQGKALGVDGKVALAPPPAPTDLLSETGGGGWTFWAVAIVGILALAFFAVAGAAVLVARQKAKVAPAPKPQAQPATESIHLACATCGKRLKVKAALRGKKVKCPGCGENTRVPASDTHVKNKTAQ